MATKRNNNTAVFKQDLGTIAEHSKEAVYEGVKKLQKGGQDMVENVEKQAYRFGEKTKDAIKEAENMTKEGLSALESNAKAHPFLTIGISVIIGMLLARL